MIGNACFDGQYNHVWKNGDAFLSQSTGACFKSSPNILDQILPPEEIILFTWLCLEEIRKQQGKRKLIEDSTLPHTETPQLRLHTTPLLLVEACVDRCVDWVDWCEISLSARSPQIPKDLWSVLSIFRGLKGWQMLLTAPSKKIGSNSEVDTWFTVVDWSRSDYSILLCQKVGYHKFYLLQL